MRTWTALILCFIGCWFWLEATPAALAEPPDAAFNADRQSFLRDMQSPNPAIRLGAVRTFANISNPRVAEWLLKRGLFDPDADVRSATRAGMQVLVRDPKVAQSLIEELKKALRKPITNEIPVELIRSLAIVPDQAFRSDLLNVIDGYLGSPKGNLLVVMTAIDCNGLVGDADSIRSIELLTRTKVFETHFGYRRSVVQSLAKIRRPEAVDLLIDILPQTDGLIQYDIVQYLSSLTGQQYRADSQAWSAWWKENRNEFEFPDSINPVQITPVGGSSSRYYGIPISAKRVVFVLDTSYSMKGAPIEAAKQALMAVIKSLHESVEFDVIMFDSQIFRWSPQLVSATADAKRKASYEVMERGLGNATASSRALKSAFELDPEIIFFLSDGAPTDGKPAEIVSAVTQWNRLRRVSIHAIAVETQEAGVPGLTTFMQPLAEQNYGTFQLVK